jgi:superkiller protein 3
MLEKSIFIGHVFSWACYHYGDYSGGNEIVNKVLSVVKEYEHSTGKLLDQVIWSLQLCKAHCMRELGGYQLTTALTLYDTLSSQIPDAIEVFYGKGMGLLSLGQYKLAKESLEKAWLLDQERIDILAQLGWTLHKLGDHEKALVYLREAIEKQPEDALHYLLLARVYWEMDGIYRTDKQYTLHTLIQAVKLDTSLSDGFTLLGHYYRMVEGDQVRAIKCYQKALSLNTQDLEAADHVSSYMLKHQQKDEAKALLERLTAMGVRAAWVWKRLGSLALASGQLPEATSYLQRALRTSQDAGAWELLADAYAQQGRYMAAIKAYARASELDKTNAFALIGMANVYRRLGLYVEAVQRLRQALQMTENTHAQVPILQGLAEAYQLAAQEEVATGYYGRAMASIQHAWRMACRLLKQAHRLHCTWRVVGDACMIARKLAAYASQLTPDIVVELSTCAQDHGGALLAWTMQQLSVDKLAVDWQDAYTFEKTMLQLAAMMYACALRGWTDVDVCTSLSFTFYQLSRLEAKYQRDVEAADRYMRAAMDCVRAGLKHVPASAKLWNALGIYAMRLFPKLSQHAFIQAIRIDEKASGCMWGVCAWTHL